MRSIHHQLLIGLLGGMFVCTLLAGVGTYLKVKEEAGELFDAQLRQVAASLPPGLAPPQQVPGLENPEDDIVVQSWDRHGKLLYRSSSTLSLPWFGAHGIRTVTALDDRWRVYGITQRDRLVQVAQAVSARDELAADLALRAVVPFLILIPAMALLIGVVVKSSLRPLHRIARSLRQRSPGALQPLETQSMPPEVTPMLEALNDLLGQLDRSITAQRAFVADAAHELRSPLTALKLQLQLAERAADKESQNTAFTKLHERVERAAHLIRQLLTLARQEALTAGQEMSDLDVGQIAELVVGDQAALADSKNIDLGLDLEGKLPKIRGSAGSLQIMLNNLVDNALRFTPPGGRVDIRLRPKEAGVLLEVIDTGPGIAEGERERVFDRFYRSAESTAGSGLGLAIVKNIVEQHHGHVTLRNNGVSGLTVAIAFPQMPS